MFLDQPSGKDPRPQKKSKNLKDYFDFRNNSRNQVGLIFFIAFVLATTLIYQFEERFDQESWRAQPNTRYKMVDDILEKSLFINDTKSEILEQLGPPNERSTETVDRFSYDIGEQPSFSEAKLMQLIITFRDSRVKKIHVQPK